MGPDWPPLNRRHGRYATKEKEMSEATEYAPVDRVPCEVIRRATTEQVMAMAERACGLMDVLAVLSTLAVNHLSPGDEQRALDCIRQRLRWNPIDLSSMMEDARREVAAYEPRALRRPALRTRARP